VSESDLVAEQFEDAEQQLETATLGMWAFLATEVLFFGVMFVAYAALRLRWPQQFAEGSRDLKLWLGGINTAVLLTSSLLVAIAVHAIRVGQNRLVVWLLIATIILGFGFLAIKGTEYHLESKEHLVPGVNFSPSPEMEKLPPDKRTPRPDQEKLFMLFYFVMTGFHALHVTVGLGVLAVMAVLAKRGLINAEYPNPLQISALYWHFVDIVWIFLYPALYLLKLG